MSALAERPRVLAPQIDIVVPVHGEEAALALSVRRLHRFLSAEFPFTWQIVIADNASTDATPAVAAALADDLAGVTCLRLERKGRGRALRAAWSLSEAQVVCYMDVGWASVTPSSSARPKRSKPPGPLGAPGREIDARGRDGRRRPSAGGRPGGADMAEAIADELGIPADEVREALEATVPSGGPPSGAPPSCGDPGTPPDDGHAAPPSGDTGRS